MWVNQRPGCARLFVAASLLAAGVFSHAGTVDVTHTSIPSGSVVNLTQQGVVDWVHWGLYTETSIDRKGGVTPTIGDFSPVSTPTGFAYVYQYGDNANGYSWSDGTPNMTATNTTTGVWAYSLPPQGSGFQFSVPASTNLQTLKVYVGAFAAKGQFIARLSDNSGGYTNPINATVNNIGNGPSAVYSIDFAADSAGQTLTVVYTVAQSYRNDGNVTLQAAALTYSNANNVPFAAISAPGEGTNFPANANITVTAVATDVDGLVSLVEFFAGTNKIGESATAPYSIVWTNAAPGAYKLTAHVTDDAGGVGVSVPVNVYVYGSGGSLTSSRALPPTTLDLTAEGTSDWAHWGLTNASEYNHRLAGGSQISNFTRIGTNTVQRYSNNRTAFSWSDGTPVLAANNAPVGVFVTGLNNGFELRVPADTATRTLRVYAGLYGAKGNFEAYLTDLSAPAYTDLTLSNRFGDSYAVYTLTFAAASSNQQLVVRYTVGAVYDFDFGNVTLQAATLQGVAAPAQVYLVSPILVPDGFAFAFVTESGRSYAAQYSPVLPATNWQTFTTVPGTGGIRWLTNSGAADPQRFYRVISQ